MGILYRVTFSKVSVAAAQDLFEITPAASKPVKLHALYLSNVGGTADAGDAQEELLPVEVRHGYTSSGSGGSAPTPSPVNPSDAACSFTAEVNNTSVASSGTIITCHADGINIRIPSPIFWTELTRPLCTTTETRIVVRLVDAPADAVVMSGTLYVEEMSILNV